MCLKCVCVPSEGGVGEHLSVGQDGTVIEGTWLGTQRPGFLSLPWTHAMGFRLPSPSSRGQKSQLLFQSGTPIRGSHPHPTSRKKIFILAPSWEEGS